ncbi:MAG: molybdopterin dinucleotide binding domain-containing protein [Candidatus Odinarchaeota archaeon]
MEMLMNTIRMIDFDQAKEYFESNDNTIKEKLAIGFLNPEDYKNLKITPKLNLKITSKFGSVIIKAKQDDNVPLGIILMPVSIWANQITGIENNELIYKNLKVNIEVSQNPILDLQDLLNSIREK